MRIAQLGPMPPPHGGVSTNMLAIHEALLRLGHKSTIVDVTNRRGGGQTAEHVIKPRSAISLLKLLLKLDCDIVHYHIGGKFSLKLALLTLFCGLLPGKKSVVTFHSGGYTLDAAARARPRSVRGIAFRSANLLIGVNEQMLRMFRAFGVDEKRMRLILPFELKRPDPSIALPADLEAFADKFDPFLLSVGALEAEYSNSFLIGAMPQILESFPNAGLMIVGSGSLEAELTSQIESLGLRDRAKMAGNLDHPVVLHLIDRADILLRITEYDGDSIAVREAMFLGTPVVASDNADRPDGVSLLRKPFNALDLTQKLIEAERLQFAGQIDPGVDGGNAEKIVEEYKALLVG